MIFFCTFKAIDIASLKHRKEEWFAKFARVPQSVFQLLKDQRCVIKGEVVKSVISENKIPVTGFSVKFSFHSR